MDWSVCCLDNLWFAYCTAIQVLGIFFCCIHFAVLDKWVYVIFRHWCLSFWHTSVQLR